MNEPPRRTDWGRAAYWLVLGVAWVTFWGTLALIVVELAR